MPLDTDDLQAFVDEDMPGYVSGTVGGVTVAGLFSNGYAEALGIGGSQPSLLLPTATAASAAQGDSVTVGGASYTIAAVEPNASGMTRLRLVEA